MVAIRFSLLNMAFCFLILLLISLPVRHAFAQGDIPPTPVSKATQAQPSPPTSNCAVKIPQNIPDFFSNLTGVVVYIHTTPSFFELAVDSCEKKGINCTKRVSSCVDRENKTSDRSSAYQCFPKPLHASNLEALVTSEVKKKFLPLIQPNGPACDAYKFEVYRDDGPINQLYLEPGILTIQVNTSILDNDNPRLAVITLNYHRIDLTPQSYWASLASSAQTAIPLDLQESQISSLLHKFFEESVITH